MSFRNLAIAASVILLLIVGVWFLNRQSNKSAPSQTATQTPQAATEGGVMVEGKTVSITAAGFSPKNMVIKQGESVTFENIDSSDHTVNSDAHPTHSLYPFLNAGLIKSGEKKTIIFEKAGKYTYHDHLNPSLTGSVTVE